jgi:predicted HicB family RNase H-like nuclease
MFAIYVVIISNNKCKGDGKMIEENKKRLNIAIEEELHRQLKVAAAQEGVTLVQFVSESIKEKIEKQSK